MFPSILSAAGLEVERHAEHFRPDCPDEEWLEYVGERRWVAITHDRRIRYKPNELSAVIRHRVRLLVVVGKQRHAVLARNFVATLPEISHFLEVEPAPFIAKVRQPSPADVARDPHAVGSVVLWRR